MSKERELLERSSTILKCYGMISGLVKEIEELLAQPEQEVYAKGYAEAMRQQVYEAFEAGRKSALSNDWDKERDAMSEAWYLSESKQEPVAWRYWNSTIGTWTFHRTDRTEIAGLPCEPLYLDQPKREPLSDEFVRKFADGDYFICIDAFIKGVRWAEAQHKIGVDDE